MSIIKKQKIWSVVLGVYLLCYFFRIPEYFVLRTDQTWVGEAIVHKVIGILILLSDVLFLCLLTALRLQLLP